MFWAVDEQAESYRLSVGLVPTNSLAVTDQFAGERPTSHYRSGSIADHPGDIAWWLEPKYRVRPLLRIARYKPFETHRLR
jgi:hypothetical protein